jgi:drug/metabolite transporter (DMT)-like permease
VTVHGVSGLVPLLAAAAAFGAVSVLARHAYESGSEPTSLLGVRLLVAALLLTAATKPTRLTAADPRAAAAAGLAGLAFAGAGLGEFEALKRAAAPAVVLLVFVAPLWIALFTRAVHGQRLGRWRALALAAILFGLGVLVASPGATAPPVAAVSLALGASVLSALFFVVLARVGASLPSRVGAAIAAWTGAVAVTMLDPDGVIRELSHPSGAAHGVAIGVLTAFALDRLAVGVTASSAMLGSAVICAEPVAAGVMSWILLGEVLTDLQLGGGVVVLLGVAVLSALSARGPPAPCATGRTRRRPRGSLRRPRPARTARPRR